MVAFTGAGLGSASGHTGAENRDQLMAEMMQQYETPINRRSSMALTEAAAAAGGHRSLFHLSMPDIAANEKQQQPALHKLASSCSGGRLRGGQKQPQNQQQRSNTASHQDTWTQLHNKKAQHRHEGLRSGGHGHGSRHKGHHVATTNSTSSSSAASTGSSSVHAVKKTRENKAKQNLNAKLEAVRKLSSESSQSSGGSTGLSSQACDSGLGTPISLIDEVSSMTTSSQNSSHLSKWRSSMSGKKLNLRLLLYQLG